MNYQQSVMALRDRDPDLARDVANFNTLENVLDWMKARRLSLATIEVVVQDEFSHDLMVPLEPGGRYLVWAMT